MKKLLLSTFCTLVLGMLQVKAQYTPDLISVRSKATSSTSVDVNLRVVVKASTSFWVQYSLDPAFTTAVLTSSPVSVFLQEAGYPVLRTISLNNLTQGSVYSFRIKTENSVGEVTYSELQTFEVNAPVNGLITEYTFDNTYNNVKGTSPFSTNAGVSLVTDRNGNVNSAINIVNTGTIATIAGLPYGAEPRTIAFWAKVNTFSSTNLNMLYSYGHTGDSQMDGAGFDYDNIWHFGYNNNHSTTATVAENTWNHFVFIYDGTDSKIYRNGVLTGTIAKNWYTVTALNDEFRLGIGVGDEYDFDGTIDELKIYNYALSESEVNTLYQGYTTSIDDEKISTAYYLYPNPASLFLNIHVSTATDISIVNLFGATVATKKLTGGNNSIDVSYLDKGVYFIHDDTGDVFKFVKE